jgi:hypothetical protein
MRMLSLTLLASGIALFASAAYAQPAGGPPPGARMGPPPGARPGPPPGTTWQNGGQTWQGGGQTWQGGGVVGPPAMGPNSTTVVRHGGGGTYGGGTWGGGGTYGHYPRTIRRGFYIPPMWWGPQFQISNWQMYGFGAPGAGQRWVRYYDDAYLVDQGGRVVDARQGLDWDRYGEQWEVTDGIPAYHGSREYTPGAEDYAWGESHGGGYGPPPGPGYGYGGGYGYAYGGGYGYGAYAYPIVIETVTTSGGMTYYEEVTEEVVQVRHRARRHRPRCVCAPPPRPVVRRPAPVRRPPPGERG